MKKQILIIGLSLTSLLGFTQLAQWDLSNLSGSTAAPVSPSVINPKIASALLSRGTGINVASLSEGFSSTGWSKLSEADAVLDNDYYEISITTGAGSNISLSSLDYKIRTSGSGPNTFIWKYNVSGGGFTNIGGTIIRTVETSTSGENQTPITLSNIPSLQNLSASTVVKLRLYGWNGGATGSFALGKGVSLSLNGSDGTSNTGGSNPNAVAAIEVTDYIKVGANSLYLGSPNTVSNNKNQIYTDTEPLIINGQGLVNPGGLHTNTVINPHGGDVNVGGKLIVPQNGNVWIEILETEEMHPNVLITDRISSEFGTINIESEDGVKFMLDKNNNGTNNSFRVQKDNLSEDLFRVGENGSVQSVTSSTNEYNYGFYHFANAKTNKSFSVSRNINGTYYEQANLFGNGSLTLGRESDGGAPAYKYGSMLHVNVAPREDGYQPNGIVVENTDPNVKKAVFVVGNDGKVRCREIEVSTMGWPDYVFANDYKLMSLDSVEKYIQTNKHLPGISAAKEVEGEEASLNLGDMQKAQMEKIEELTLYIIELNKKLAKLETLIK